MEPNDRYFLATGDLENKIWVEVYAEPIEIKGLEDYDFFTHLSMLELPSGNVVSNPYYWGISEGITGLAIVKSEDSADDAFLMAEFILNSPENLAIIDEEIKKVKDNPKLISPRYGEAAEMGTINESTKKNNQ